MASSPIWVGCTLPAWALHGERLRGKRYSVRPSNERRPHMKAAIMVPGSAGGVWEVRDVQRPVVAPGQVLVRVRASSINRAEFRRLHTMKIEPGKPPQEARAGGGDASGERGAGGPGVAGMKEGDW